MVSQDTEWLLREYEASWCAAGDPDVAAPAVAKAAEEAVRYDVWKVRF